MVTVEQVTALALALPEVTESTSFGHRAWTVGGPKAKNFAWIRPFSKADLKRFGTEPAPAGDILAVRVGDLAEKEAVLAAHPDAFFTIAHFDGFAAVLIALDVADADAVGEALEDAWLACAPAASVQTYLAEHPTDGP